MKTRRNTERLPAWLAAIMITGSCLGGVQALRAATDTWNGGATPNGNWTNPGNWNGSTPATNDLLVFAGSTQTASTNNYTAGFPFENLAFGSGAGAFNLTGNSLTLSSPQDAGSGLIKNGSINDSATANETIKFPLLLAAGYHTIANTGAGTLNLNGLVTHSNGAAAVFSGNVNATGGLSTNGNSYGILGGWAVLASGDWATLDAHSNIVAYTTYVTNLAGTTIANNAAANIKIPLNGTANSVNSGVTTVNSIIFGNGAAATSGGTQVINIGAGNTLVLGQNGGVFNSTSLGQATSARQLTIGASVAAGGTLTAGDGINPAQITFGNTAISGGFATVVDVNSVISDNNLLGNHAPVSVAFAGSYFSINGGGNAAVTNTYSGGTYILQGRVSQPGRYTFGTGPVYIFPGGQANCGCQMTNDFYISGSGTVENNGMGALRLYAASVSAGYSGNIQGTVHLMGTAAIGGNNNANTGPLIGVSGKITGPGGLMISSPTATQSGAGTVNIGSTNGAFDVRNDYAGDTTINGTTLNGTAVNSVLEICNAADNNIMPHGATGNYAGGPTGNLIENATAANRQAIFELNGSTQTINGLGSIGTSAANNIVQDSLGGGALILGDNNATATFGGVVQSALTLTKIGSGTETLSGGNTYNGNTTIQAGTLVTTTASTGDGNFSVSNSAALGVVTATSGGTLQVNNLTFGTGTSALQLSAGTAGDPSAAVVNVNGALAMNGTVNISLSGVGLTAGGPFTVLTYNPANRTGAGVFVLNNSPRVVATLNDNTASGVVTITIISADTAIKWRGNVSGNWDINDTGNLTWLTYPSGNTADYIEAGNGNDTVVFDDTLTGTPNVNLTTTVTPLAVTVSNSVDNYLFTGTGAITGAAGLTKAGTGSLTIGNSGNNNFSGPIAINGGTLIISNNSTIGNTITGTGALMKSGNGSTLTMSGDSTGYNGPVTINGGTLSVQNSISLATASSTAIANGATLDIGNNNVALGQVPITVAGPGVGGNGAIVNSSGYGGGAIATSFQNLTMVGDTTIGGPGRLDFRSSDPNGGADGVLSTGGNAYNLTKVSDNTLQLGSVQVDAALGNITVQGGTLGIQGNMPFLGNPTNTLTIGGGCTLQFLNLAFDLNKVLALNSGAIVNDAGGNANIDGTVALQGNTIVNVLAGTSLTFTNVLSGAGGISLVTGAGSTVLESSNTYTGNTVINLGGLYLTGAGDIRDSHNVIMNTGTTLDVSGRPDDTLTILGGNTFDGTGTLNGNLTNEPASLFSIGAGTATGTLSVSGAASLSGITVMKVVETNLTADLLQAGSIAFGGTLQINNLTGSYISGDQIQLFTGAFSGMFTNIIPATPGYNLQWDTNALATLGVLSVIGPGANQNATNITASVSGGNLVLGWPMDHTGWQLQVQVVPLSAGLGANWTTIPGSGLTNQISIPLDAANGAVFYRMFYP